MVRSLQNLSFWVVSQTLFFLPNRGLLPIVEVVLPERGIRPRRIAKTPKPKKGKYIINSLSDALWDPISSDNIVTWNSDEHKM